MRLRKSFSVKIFCPAILIIIIHCLVYDVPDFLPGLWVEKYFNTGKMYVNVVYWKEIQKKTLHKIRLD